jgi:hypothetical protein
MPPPAVQPARVFEEVALVPGTPVKKPVVSTMVVLKPVKATPAVPYISARSQAIPRRPRIEPFGLGGGRYAPRSVAHEVIHGHRKGMAQACAVDGTFEAEHRPLVILKVVANMGAANRSLRSVAKCAARQLIIVRYSGPGHGIVAPGVADLAANIEAGPGEDRSWRRWCRCGLGRKGRSSKSSRWGECAGAGHRSLFRHDESSM